MRKRCENQNDRNYARYGGRGIAVCARWQDFQAFLADMGACPEGYSIERIDNDGNYEPDNCRWADRRDQNQNRSNVRPLVIDGVSRCVADWARIAGIDHTTVHSRLRRGWTPYEAVFGKEHNTNGNTECR